MAVYSPALMLQGDGGLSATAYVVSKAVLSIGLWGASSIGYLWGPLSWPERVLAAAGAFMLVAALPYTDEAGFVLCAIFLLVHRGGAKRRLAARGA
jgi:TRAP-type uncharacterized transport system fused permease subunit